MNSSDTRETVSFVEEIAELRAVSEEMKKVIVGQAQMGQSLLIGLLTNGHVLLEGLPGLAKTLAVKTLATVLDAKFQRVQFTPDLLPSDLIGTLIYRPSSEEFVAKKGPIFTHILLADEINRAPAKVQSALLEAMAEKQITLGETTYRLEEPFLVLATQNPIEQEGTYPLPEAQLDRFMLKIKVGYPNRSEELAILERMADDEAPVAARKLSIPRLLEIRQKLKHIYVSEALKQYLIRIVLATRAVDGTTELNDKEVNLTQLSDVQKDILVGCSPRATLFLMRAAKAHALLNERTYVTPDDVKEMAFEVLRHRMILTLEAEARRVTPDSVIGRVLECVVVP